MITEQDKSRDEIILVLQTLMIEGKIQKITYDNLHARVKLLEYDEKKIIEKFIREIMAGPSQSIVAQGLTSTSAAQKKCWFKNFGEYTIEIRQS